MLTVSAPISLLMQAQSSRRAFLIMFRSNMQKHILTLSVCKPRVRLTVYFVRICSRTFSNLCFGDSRTWRLFGNARPPQRSWRECAKALGLQMSRDISLATAQFYWKCTTTHAKRARVAVRHSQVHVKCNLQAQKKRSRGGVPIIRTKGTILSLQSNEGAQRPQHGPVTTLPVTVYGTYRGDIGPVAARF